jgi:hypothetical protein
MSGLENHGGGGRLQSQLQLMGKRIAKRDEENNPPADVEQTTNNKNQLI